MRGLGAERQRLSQREPQRQSGWGEFLWVGIAVFLPSFSFSCCALMLLPGEWLVLTTAALSALLNSCMVTPPWQGNSVDHTACPVTETIKAPGLGNLSK